MNKLFYGDCLQIMNEMKLAAVDLIYLDPPFNSNRTYNTIYKDKTGRPLPEQIEAFCDIWELNEERERAITAMPVLMREAGIDDSAAALWKLWMNALRNTQPSLLAYLSYMTERLVVMKGIMKPTASLYLHCDPTASHYVKALMDAIFGHQNFRNEIIWRRTGAHNKSEKWAPVHDVILFYTASDQYKWNHPKQPYMQSHVDEHFEKDGKGYKTAYYGNVLTGSGTRKGESGKTWKGIDPTAKNRHWAIPGKLWEDSGLDAAGLTQHEKLDLLFEHGYIKIIPGQAWPMYERRIRPTDGPAMNDIWAYQPYTEGTVFSSTEGIDADVSWIKPRAKERLGYPTQKPVGLIRRIIEASTDEGDIVLDPFCGCATTIAAAHELKREWIGIDIAYHAIRRVVQARLLDQYRLTEGDHYEVAGIPGTKEAAIDLWERDKYQFQRWAVETVDGFVTTKRSNDGGIDGRIYLAMPDTKHLASMIVEVKGGENIGIKIIRELRGAMDGSGAEMAGLIIRENLGDRKSRNFAKEMAKAGDLDVMGIKYPRMQILTVDDIFEGERFKTPSINAADKGPGQLALSV